jgi:hypothetical protein
MIFLIKFKFFAAGHHVGPNPDTALPDEVDFGADQFFKEDYALIKGKEEGEGHGRGEGGGGEEGRGRRGGEEEGGEGEEREEASYLGRLDSEVLEHDISNHGEDRH